MSDRIRSARESKDWTQTDLANHAGVSTASVTRLERGLAPEDGEAAKKVMAALGLSVDHSLSGQASTSPERGPTMPSTMGQMIGRLQLPAGTEDYYTEVLQLALEREEPAAVFLDLAKARTEAPPDARSGWWMRRFLTAVERERTKSARK